MKQFELLAIMPRPAKLPPDDRLHFINADGYTAILSAVARPSLLLPRSRKQALSDAAYRQAQLEKCMPYGPLIVCRPRFTVSKDDIAGLIITNRLLLDRLAARLDGKVQYQITVNWAAEGVLARFRESDEISPLFQGESIKPEALARAVQRLAGRLADDITHTLSDVTDDILRLPTEPDMIFNAVLLLGTDNIDRLNLAVDKVDRIWTEGFRIKQIGPSPAASFALLDPQMVNQRDLAAAYRHLGLKEPQDTAEIARARKDTLRAAPQQTEFTNYCARIAEAALTHEDGDKPLFICNVCAEERNVTPMVKQVA